MVPGIGTKVVFERNELDRLITALRERQYRVVGPTVGEGAILYEEMTSSADLPAGWTDSSQPATYRLNRARNGRVFGYTLAAQSWKRHLYPPRQRLFRAERAGRGFRLSGGGGDEAPMAFIGVRACEMAAMQVHDRVFTQDGFTEPGYVRRRQAAFVVAVECAHAGATCFCASTGTGPAVGPGYDILLNEILDAGRHVFVATAGSEKGGEILAGLSCRAPAAAELSAAAAQPASAAAEQQRRMSADAAGVLSRSAESPHWDNVAGRCLTCGNCTMVCPTCFCTSVEDVTDLSGDIAERWRNWDSCFTIDYSYIHGGSVRQSGASRYRQWITHKLASWQQQFGTSGCVGCGRCITWCPVGIDITAEVRALEDREQGR